MNQVQHSLSSFFSLTSVATDAEPHTPLLNKQTSETNLNICQCGFKTTSRYEFRGHTSACACYSRQPPISTQRKREATPYFNGQHFKCPSCLKLCDTHQLKTHLAAEKVATVLQTSLDQSQHVTSEQESHHSVRDVYAHFHHGSRDSLPLAAPTLKTKIKLPRANERKSWQHINDEIERAGATRLSSDVLRSEALDEVVANLHRIVRSTLEQFSPPLNNK